ncbi:MAG: hypothetical protein JWO92_1121 [Chitinophagaceae bacterium]|nr:hypothetical protein [Chitinophagaceae bacterium]
MITVPQIIKFAPGSQKLADIVVKNFNEYNCKYEVNTPLRISAFLAQLIHESGSFRYTREIASGVAYEGRKVLGNVFPGDGVRFKGRGLIQITGRNNYAALSKDLTGTEKTFLDNPDLLSIYPYAMTSAFWFWNKNGLNKYADIQYFETITKRINGGLNGFTERIEIYNRINKDFGLPIYKPS